MATTTTASNGAYSFAGLLPDDYVVVVTAPAGYRITAADVGADDTIDSDVAPDGRTAAITVAAGVDITDVDAGFYEPVTIGDTVFFDRDGDGTADADDPGLAGVVRHRDVGRPRRHLRDRRRRGVVDDHHPRWASTASTICRPGLIRVVATMPPGMTPTTGVSRTVAIASGGTRLDVDLGVTGTGSLGVLVYGDRDRDSVADVDEPGLPAVTVIVTWAGADGVLGTVRRHQVHHRLRRRRPLARGLAPRR